MRVISQDGTIDFPYEQISVYLQGNVVLCHSMFDMGKYKVLGNYSTEEKAKKAMEMLRDAYECACYCNDAFDSAAQVQRPYLFMNNRVFQFPQDSEVEV